MVKDNLSQSQILTKLKMLRVRAENPPCLSWVPTKITSISYHNIACLMLELFYSLFQDFSWYISLSIYLILSNLISSNLIKSNLISSYLIVSYLILYYLILSYNLSIYLSYHILSHLFLSIYLSIYLSI